MKIPSFTRPARTEHAAQCMAEIRRILSSPQRAGNWWAHQVMAKVSAGEHVTPFAYELAKRAIERGASREPGSDDE